jgi:hypothetical protein
MSADWLYVPRLISSIGGPNESRTKWSHGASSKLRLLVGGGTGQVVLTISSGTRGCTARMREEFC